MFIEFDKAEKLKNWIDKKSQSVDKSWGIEINLQHGTVRYIKSICLLFLQHLKTQRDYISSSQISRFALNTLDQQIGYFFEKINIGVFKNASPIPLMIEINTKNDTSEKKYVLFPDISMKKAPPVIISSIEILDTELRTRCLDLFIKFQEDGQQERLDTVLTEACRVLEDRLRKISGAKKETVGVELAKYAFGKDSPKLIISEILAEQEAVHLLFRGFFGFIRNHVGHHLIQDLSAERVLQIIGFVDYQLLIIQEARVLVDNE